jgi:hypothetical protein
VVKTPCSQFHGSGAGAERRCDLATILQAGVDSTTQCSAKNFMAFSWHAEQPIAGRRRQNGQWQHRVLVIFGENTSGRCQTRERDADRGLIINASGRLRRNTVSTFLVRKQRISVPGEEPRERHVCSAHGIQEELSQ